MKQWEKDAIDDALALEEAVWNARRNDTNHYTAGEVWAALEAVSRIKLQLGGICHVYTEE